MRYLKMKIISGAVFMKINAIFLISVLSSALQAQAESHFLLNQSGVQFNTKSPHLIVTYGVLGGSVANSTQVTTMSSNPKNKEIYNQMHGVYLTTVTQDVLIHNRAINSLASLTEARRITNTDGHFTHTKFNHKDGKAQIRTNCNVSEKWGLFTTKNSNKGEQFNCVTANEKFCSHLESLKTELNSSSFQEIAKKVESCANSLGIISNAAEKLHKYTNSDEYEKIAKTEFDNLYELRKNVDIGLKMKFSTLAPESRETFSINMMENNSKAITVASVFKLANKIKEASIACAALEDSNKIISEHLSRHSQVTNSDGAKKTVKAEE